MHWVRLLDVARHRLEKVDGNALRRRDLIAEFYKGV